MTPVLDLNRYHCSAVIDWLEFRFCTFTEHQSLNVQKVAARFLGELGARSTVFVSGPERQPGYQGSDFLVRVQDPQPRRFYLFLEALHDRYAARADDVGKVQISGVEVAVDFRVADTGSISPAERDHLRWQMTEVLRRHIRPEPVLTDLDRNWPRYYTEKQARHTAQYWVDTKLRAPSALLHRATLLGLDGRVAAPLSLEAHNQPPLDLTSYIGAKEAPIMLRIMDKISDRRDPEKKCSVPLEAEHKRSRIEVSLKGDWDKIGGAGAVGLQTIGDLYGYDFKQHRKPLFEFFLPTVDLAASGRLPPPASLSEMEAFQRTGVYGLDRVHRALASIHHAEWAKKRRSTRPVRLGKKGRLLSYVELNQKVDRALRSLSRRWESPCMRIVGTPGPKSKAL
ncbi:hypothetical protein [Ovoidimarina sediminis]|uniref:hypothetical protein n=1 Tax=Ovoidimarina sediminis TaxID=3079856 RepID=UPI0029124F7E|nr:hypothetical protein [Rhodophyticola sp. MJ-SS7]MDU8946340.1 hypothetical protein [Rhodophyticola sp. MJ-SS7]